MALRPRMPKSLYIRCGTTQDGCAIHKRVHCTAAWYPHWGIRRFPGTLGYQATECCRTPDQQARLQAATDEANAINAAAEAREEAAYERALQELFDLRDEANLAKGASGTEASSQRL